LCILRKLVLFTQLSYGLGRKSDVPFFFLLSSFLSEVCSSSWSENFPTNAHPPSPTVTGRKISLPRCTYFLGDCVSSQSLPISIATVPPYCLLFPFYDSVLSYFFLDREAPSLARGTWTPHFFPISSAPLTPVAFVAAGLLSSGSNGTMTHLFRPFQGRVCDGRVNPPTLTISTPFFVPFYLVSFLTYLPPPHSRPHPIPSSLT